MVQILQPREVPLGGPRAMTVRRTLPHRDRSLVGAWCFADHYGPDDVTGGPGMDVPPHPHMGLSTLSWLFSGEVEHRDSAGVHEMVRPGEVNLMTAGRGIAHSEVSTPETRELHGVQLWIVAPDATRNGERAFHHHVPDVVPLPDGAGSARVLVGSLAGVGDSPVPTATPLVGAELTLDGPVTLTLDPAFEYAVLVDTGAVTVDGTRVERGAMAVLDPGADGIGLEPDGSARVMLLGGEPFTEPVVMWWNLIGRDHDEIVAARDEWQAGTERFGEVPGYPGGRLSAPPMPGVRLKPRHGGGRRETHIEAEPPAVS